MTKKNTIILTQEGIKEANAHDNYSVLGILSPYTNQMHTKKVCIFSYNCNFFVVPCSEQIVQVTLHVFLYSLPNTGARHPRRKLVEVRFFSAA